MATKCGVAPVESGETRDARFQVMPLLHQVRRAGSREPALYIECGKTASMRVKRVGQPEITEIRSWDADGQQMRELSGRGNALQALEPQGGAPGRSRTCDPRIRSSRAVFAITHAFSRTSILTCGSTAVRQSAVDCARLRPVGDTPSDIAGEARCELSWLKKRRQLGKIRNSEIRL